MIVFEGSIEYCVKQNYKCLTFSDKISELFSYFFQKKLYKSTEKIFYGDDTLIKLI